MSELYRPIKILLADDHEVLRDGFQVMMKKQFDVEIIGEASNGEDLVRQAHQKHPDVIVTDIEMPLMSGIEATIRLTKELPEIGIIAFSVHNEESLILDMLKAGALGYIHKTAGKDQVMEAIKTVSKGHPYYCNETNNILKASRQKNKNKVVLTEKELLIIQLICKECSNIDISQQLSLSKRTIEDYRERIMEKINAKNAVGIVLYAIKNRIFQFNS
jgi:DNA-binding NarL/FixJ family response regulator